MSDGIATRRADGVLEIAFDRSEKKNAITAAMYTALGQAVREADADDDIRVILFHGQGDSFCAGNDLEDFAARPPADESAPAIVVIRAQRAFASRRRPTRPVPQTARPRKSGSARVVCAEA